MKKSPTSGIYSATKEIDMRIRSMLLAGVFQMKNTAEKLAYLGKLEVLSSISRKGSYKAYKKKGVDRMSSQPGTPPAAEKGEDLEPSIYSKVISKNNQNPAVAEFGSTASFAKTIEFGNSKIPARPFMLPARQKVAQVAPAIVVTDLVRAYQKNLSKKSKSATVVVEFKV